MVPFERALVSSYKTSIVTFPLSLRVSEILPLLQVLQNATVSHPPLVSPKFPHVLLGVGGWLLSMQLVSKLSTVCGPDPVIRDPPTSQTDDMQSQYRALHYSTVGYIAR